jgi:hypothetical protein
MKQERVYKIDFLYRIKNTNELVKSFNIKQSYIEYQIILSSSVTKV